MFTGLIQDMGTLKEARRSGGPVRLVIEPDSMSLADVELGESIATSGICLTVVERGARTFSVDVGQETLNVATAASWGPGRRVNLERSLRLNDLLGGHLVMGHVDGIGEVRARREEAGVVHFDISLPEEMAPLVTQKGSIAVDGVSLTVNDVTQDAFRITLIPETLRRTTLGLLHVGDRVNLEADILARHLARLLAFGAVDAQAGRPKLDLAFLSKHGYQ